MPMDAALQSDLHYDTTEMEIEQIDDEVGRRIYIYTPCIYVYTRYFTLFQHIPDNTYPGKHACY
jgi:hypothetical protein